MRVRHLLIRVSTPQGLFGARAAFPDGLVALRGPNTSGKSTCLQSIVYALGLEGMFGPSHDVPLPHVVTDYVEYGDEQLQVLSSEVLIELENSQGSILTVERSIRGETDRNLVKTWAGPALSKPGGRYPQRDFFVREPGSALRAAGFHAHLEAFLGWTLPQVPRFSGPDVKLYLEAIFPLFYVEQKKGWSAIEGRFPTYLGIRDTSSRAVEFVLNLDAYDLIARRNSIRTKEQEILARWQRTLAELVATAKTVGGILEGFPRQPVSEWPPAVTPRVVVPQKADWQPLDIALEELQQRLVTLQSSSLPTVEESASAAGGQLAAASDRLVQSEREAVGILENLEADRVQLANVRTRLRAIEEDLVRNRDAQKLRRLGSTTTWTLAIEECPTCHQSVEDSLLPQEPRHHPMTIEHNIEFLEEQQRVFRLMEANAASSAQARQQRYQALMEQLDQLRQRIRGLKRTLISDPRLPSQAAIEERVTLQSQIDRMLSAQRAIGDITNGFPQAVEEWREVQKEKRELPDGSLSKSDVKKLGALQELLQDQLKAYGFRSVDPESVQISMDTYRPVHQGFDLQFDLSASDTIRTIWAYRLALLEVARTSQSHHPGFLIIDEPRQQETSNESLRAFYRRAAQAGTFGQQVIVASSRNPEDTVEAVDILQGLPHSEVYFDTRVIAPLDVV